MLANKKTVETVKATFTRMIDDLSSIIEREDTNQTMAQAEVDRARAEGDDAIAFRTGLVKLVSGQ